MDDLIQGTKHYSPDNQGIPLLITLFLGIAFVSFVGVYWFRQRQKNRPRRKHHHHRSSQSGEKIEESSKRVRKRGYRHRHHRPHNPTLAQTNGLPPIRSSNNSDAA